MRVTSRTVMLSSIAGLIAASPSTSIAGTSCTLPGFGYAAFGRDSVKFTGNGATDSYNSTVGPYATSKCTSAANCVGSVATNGTSSGAITLTGNASVKGTCNIGSGGAVSAISGSSGCNSTAVSGGVVNLLSVNIPAYSNASPFAPSSGALAPNKAYGDISV